MHLAADELATIGRLLGGFGAARMKKGLSADEALIYLAVGRLGIANIAGARKAIPVRCQDVGELLKMPRETIRRKSERLETKEMVTISSGGLIISDMEDWRRFSELFRINIDSL